MNEPNRISLIGRLFQIEGMRRGSWWVHADLRTVPVSGDSSRPSDLDRPGLRTSGKRLCLQAEKFGKRVYRYAAGCSKLLNVRQVHTSRKHLWIFSVQRTGHSKYRVLLERHGIERFPVLKSPARLSNGSIISSMLECYFLKEIFPARVCGCMKRIPG